MEIKILKELVDKYTWRQIRPRLLKIYPGSIKSIDGYRYVFKQLKSIDVITKKKKLLIKLTACHDSDEGFLLQ